MQVSIFLWVIFFLLSIWQCRKCASDLLTMSHTCRLLFLALFFCCCSGYLFLLLFRLQGFPVLRALGGWGGALQNSMGGSLRNGVLNILVKSLKRSVWVFDVTNRKNGFSNFQSYHWVVMYLFNSLAKSCKLFWKYS